MTKKLIIFGNAGFIGMHVSLRFLAAGFEVIGVDSLNSYYSVDLKNDRLKAQKKFKKFTFIKANIASSDIFQQIDMHKDADYIINLAAQPGVRYSLENPHEYVESNIVGQLNILEFARNMPNLQHFLYASSSSVYGDNAEIPFNISAEITKPKSLYAATKVSVEAMSYCYSSIYNLKLTGLRFFTVYGPFGRPDMAMYGFTDNIYNDRPIKLYNNGNLQRDFTYIDDIVDGIEAALYHLPSADAQSVHHKVYNLGNNNAEKLQAFVEAIEVALKKKAIIEYVPMQPGDVYSTYADITESKKDLNFQPKISMFDGVQKFVDWYLSYHSTNEAQTVSVSQ